MKTQTIFILTFSGFLTLYACKAKKPSSDAGAAVVTEPAVAKIKCAEGITYLNHVKTVIDNQCANSCHSAAKKIAGIDLSSYDNVKEQARMRRFIGSLKHEEYYSPMPKMSQKLSDSTIQVIECWIQSGMVN